ncbi:MAG TPA: hypothetical protein VF070_25230 [Streptosporangiaceae bacterium]
MRSSFVHVTTDDGITGNSGGALVAANTISGPSSCSGNNPPRPTAGSPARSAARPPASAPPRADPGGKQ